MTKNFLPSQPVYDANVGDQKNPKSLVNLVPDVLAGAISGLPQDLLAMSPEELEAKAPRKRFSHREHQLRLSFWNEYERSVSSGSKMNLTRVYSGICTRKAFYDIVHDPLKLAFVVHAPDNYAIAMEELLLLGVRRLREILMLPLRGKDGRPDARIAEVVLKAYEKVDMRVHGAIVQRVEQRNLNVNYNSKDQKEAGSSSPALTEETVDQELRLLEMKLSGAEQSAPADIVVNKIKFRDVNG
jgi:hypothetical protein